MTAPAPRRFRHHHHAQHSSLSPHNSHPILCILSRSRTAQADSSRGFEAHLYSLMPSLSSLSSKQLKATILSGATPCTSKIWQTALEKPH